MIDVPGPIWYWHGNCQVIQEELNTISNTAITFNLPIRFMIIFIIVSNACLTVIIPIILTGTLVFDKTNVSVDMMRHHFCGRIIMTSLSVHVLLVGK